jgi:hypothetical protein
MRWMGRGVSVARRVAAMNQSRSVLTAWVGVGITWVAVGCGQASAPSGVGADAGLGGSGQGRTPALAPLCEATSVPFVSVEVAPWYDLALNGTPMNLRVVARGFGFPAELTGFSGAGSPEEMGWLRLAPSSGDAGLPGGDAGASASRDAGDAGDAGESTESELSDPPGAPLTRVIVGPRAIGELPVAVGDEVALSIEDRVATYMPGRHEIILKQGDRVLLVHQADGGGGSVGFTLAVGDTLCGTPFNDCADFYRHDLEVTVPGGATATLAPGQSQTLGAYRVFHGSTESVTQLPGGGCADVYDGWISSQFTAVLLPSAQ